MHVFQQRYLILAVLLLALGCSDKTGKELDDPAPDVGLGADTPGALQTDPSLDFGTVEPVSDATRGTVWQLTEVTNIGDREVGIRDIIIESDAVPEAFSLTFPKIATDPPEDDRRAEPQAVAAGESLLLRVYFDPTNREPATGRVFIYTDESEDDEYVIELTGNQPPDAVLDTESLEFIDVALGDTNTQTVTVVNNGKGELDIRSIKLVEFTTTDPGGVEFTNGADWAESAVLSEGETLSLSVDYSPTDTDPDSGNLELVTNDPKYANGLIQVPLRTVALRPCLSLSHEDEIDFGVSGIGYTSNRTVIIENCSTTADLNVASIDVCTDVANGTCDPTSPIYTIKDGSLPDGLPGSGATIGPRDSTSFVLSYRAENLDVSTGELTVKSNDPDKSILVVPIRGEGTNNACPTAVGEAKLSDGTRWETTIATIPLKTIQFRGTSSVDVDGTINRYEWNLIQRPTNSTARMTPSPDVAEPTLFLDLAGEYIVELKVYDNDGTESCGDQALVTIDATPDEDIHIQLVWNTPSDADQTDAFGTDLDLHFLHPNGAWNNAPWDIYWLNPTSEWGNPGGSDDPSLDIDDTDGAGPENANMQEPQGGLSYAVGVYYYADNGHGPSYATIRIYIRGTQSYEYRDMHLPTTGTFWYAATITWPSGAVTAINNVRQGFPGN